MALAHNKRFFLIAPAVLSLIAALDAGLLRLGWVLPLPQADLLLAHGPLMVCAFLGTFISLERAVAINRPWAYAAPLLTGPGGLWLIAAPTAATPRLFFLVGSICLGLVSAIFFRRQPTLFNASVALGALGWVLGNGLWFLGWPLYAVVPFWMGFLLLTIAGERLELSRLLSPSVASRTMFTLSIGAFLTGLFLTAFGFASETDARVVLGMDHDVFTSERFDLGARFLGAAMLGSGLWLLYYDMARRSLRKEGLTRFIAVSLLLGYGWLVLAGFLWLFNGAVVGGAAYDGMLHVFFLGFVFGMIFAHAPIIFPAVLKRSLDFHPAFYTHVVLLQIGLLVRVGGDLSGWFQARSWGGMLNALALVLFFGNTAFRVLKGRSLA